MRDVSGPRTEIRRAQIGDAAEMTRLSAQLGYPLAPAEMMRRLTNLLTNERHHVAVAARGALVVGWMHVEHRSTLEGGERAELMGLVVDASARRQGLGRELVDAAEHWAVSRGLPSLTVRSNTARELSHPFYEALGYSRDKTQHVYSKALGKPPGPHVEREHPRRHRRRAVELCARRPLVLDAGLRCRAPGPLALS